MIAVFYEGQEKLKLREIPLKAPENNEVRIKVSYCGICGTDMHIFHGMMDNRVKIPQIIGHEMSGIVDVVGENVTGFKKEDKVVVCPLDFQGKNPSDEGMSHVSEEVRFMGIDSPGAMQEYWNVPAGTLIKIPDHTQLKFASLTEPLAVACHNVRIGKVRQGNKVLILGGGTIGMLIALVARYKGANVMISEINGRRIKIASSLGFEAVHPDEVDLIQYLKAKNNGKLADVVFEVSGAEKNVELMTDLVGIHGRLIVVAIHGKAKKINLFSFFWKELVMRGARTYEKEDFLEAIRIIAENDLPLEKFISRIEKPENTQKLFESVSNDPAGLKSLISFSS